MQRLLALDTLHIEQLPTLTWNELTPGYEVRDFIIALDYVPLTYLTAWGHSS